jgi:hypothetical protein
MNRTLRGSSRFSGKLVFADMKISVKLIYSARGVRENRAVGDESPYRWVDFGEEGSILAILSLIRSLLLLKWRNSQLR